MDAKLALLILDSIFDGVYFVDRDRRITFWNKGAERISGFSREEVTGKRCRDQLLNHMDEDGCLLCDKACPFLESMETKANHRATIYMHTKDRRKVPIETHVTPIVDENGEVIGGVEVFRDISDWKKVEALSNEKSEMIGIAAHDLRGPLSIINMHAYLLKDSEFHDAAEVIDKIIDVSLKTIDMLDSMLDINKIESGIIRLDLQKVDIVQLLGEAVNNYKVIAMKKNIELAFYSEPGRAEVLADRDRISDVFNNLISNAIKYSEFGQMVRIKIDTPRDGMLCVHVIDEGPGISGDEINKVFKKFAQISTMPTDGETKTGLGLAIVKRVVELHNGEVNVESEPGKGTRFVVKLPIN